MAGLADLGRFSEPALHVLISLADGPKHGYAMMEDIEHHFGARLGPGTLYGAISRLEAAGLIEALAEEQRRKPYRITDAGLAALRDQLASMQTVVTTGLRRVAAP